MQTFGPLYKRDTTGRIREWIVELDDVRYRTVAGLLDGQKVTSNWTTVEQKNVGRANETSLEEQALFEVQALVKKKLEQGGYHNDIKNVDKPRFFKPMLAKKFEDYAPTENEFGFIFAQPKLDGMRCIADSEGLWSRQGKPVVSVPHIHKALESLFEQHPDLVLDGELYAHKLKHNFAKIMSLCKKTKPTAENLAESAETVKYFVYDVPSVDGNYSERFKHINDLLGDFADCIVICPTIQPRDQFQLDKAFQNWLVEGYEGQIVRRDAVYEQKRTKSLLKRKTFEDAEFTVLKIEEGNGNRSGMAGRVYCKTAKNEIFKAELKGNWEYCRYLLENADQFVGTDVTVQFMGYSKEDGLPRHPVAVYFHEGKRMT